MEETSIENKVSCSTQGMSTETQTVAGSDNPTESLTEKSRLTELEKTIEREERSNAHLAIGKALQQIQGAELYRIAGYRAFNSYAKKRFGYHRSYVNRLINYAKEVEKCVANGDTPPESEGSFRANKRKSEKRSSRKPS